MSGIPSTVVEISEIGENEVVPSRDLPAGDKEMDQNETKIIIMDELPSKNKLEGDENILDVLTEKQPEAIQGRCRFFWVFSESGEALDYDPGRNSFIAITFGIVFILLCISGAGLIAGMTSDNVKDFMQGAGGMILMVTAVVSLLVVQVALCCSFAQKMPCVFIVLFCAVYGFTVLLIFIGCRYAPDIIIAALAATAIVCLICFLLALTPLDFTKFYMVVIIASLAIFVALIVCSFLRLVFGVDVTIARLVILCISVVVQAVMFVIELQMIIGGKALELTTDEYFFAALLVYLSVIELFITLLQIIATVYDLLED